MSAPFPSRFLKTPPGGEPRGPADSRYGRGQLTPEDIARERHANLSGRGLIDTSLKNIERSAHLANVFASEAGLALPLAIGIPGMTQKLGEILADDEDDGFLETVLAVMQHGMAQTPGGTTAMRGAELIDQRAEDAGVPLLHRLLAGMGFPDLMDAGQMAAVGGMRLGRGSRGVVAGGIGAEDMTGIRFGKDDVSGALQQPMSVPADAPKGRRTITEASRIRDMDSLEEATAFARTGPHLKQDKSGQFVGAPRGIKSMEDIRRARQEFDRIALEGIEHSDWYERSRAGIREIAGENPKKQFRTAKQLGIASSQATPDTNLGGALRGQNRIAAGLDPDVRTGNQSRAFAELEATGDTTRGLGPKTGNFASQIDPSRPSSVVATNDIWQGRAWGYTNADGTLFDRGFTKQEHAWLDAESVLAAERANRSELLGRTDWHPEELQAAAWVRKNGEAMAKSKGISLEEGMDLATEAFPDHFPEYTAYLTAEEIPGAGIGHLEELIGQPQPVREAFSADPRGGFINQETGRDEILDALDMLQRPAQPSTGSFTSQATGQLEVNPARVSRPLVSFERGPDGQTLPVVEQRLLEGSEAFRSFFSAQNAGAFNKDFVFPKMTKLRGTTGFVIPHEEPLDADQMRALVSLAEEFGFGGDTGFVASRGSSTILQGFGEGGAQLKKQLAKGGLGKRLKEIFPDLGDVNLARIEGDLVDLEDAWATPGSGEATARMLEKVSSPEAPKVFERLDSSPELRARVAGILERDAEWAAKNGWATREDITRARQIFASGGLTGLRDALRRGAVLPAVALPALLFGLQDAGEDAGGA